MRPASLVTPGRAASFITPTNPYLSYENPYSEDPTGAYLRGVADLTRSQAAWSKDLQEAELAKEQTRQARLETQRQDQDEQRREHDLTPSFEADRQRSDQQQLSRSLNDPPLSEIYSGQALNVLLDEIVRSRSPLLTGQDNGAPLEADVIAHLNVRGATETAALLPNEDRLVWPLALQDQTTQSARQRVAEGLRQALRQLKEGTLDVRTVHQLSAAVAELRQHLSAQAGDLRSGPYLEASRFLSELEKAIRLLGRPDARQLLAPKLPADLRTMGQLVRYLDAHGLHFAPALSGDEGAYVAVHRGLALALRKDQDITARR